jgi:tripartite-type tricarboxylate transporter receptor subunit TctC
MLKMSLRLIIGLTVFVFVFGSNESSAQPYPSHPVRVLVGVAPGGVTDLAARIILVKVGEKLGQQFVVDNRPGGSGVIAASAGAKAAPDGYTLYMGNIADMAVNPALQPNLPYDPLKDFAPVAAISDTALTLAVHPSVAAKDLRQLIDLVKSQPGKIAFASAGNGTVPQLVGEWLNHAAGMKMIHVPYKGGGPSTQDVVAGHVPVGVIAVSAATPHARAGRLRVLGVSTEKRLAFQPDWPTIAESGFPGFNASVWVALFAPAATPKEIVSLLNAEVNRVLKLPEVRERFNAQGADVLGGSAEELGGLVRADLQRFGRMVREFNIRAD